jgi:hypothetical protein
MEIGASGVDNWANCGLASLGTGQPGCIGFLAHHHFFHTPSCPSVPLWSIRPSVTSSHFLAFVTFIKDRNSARHTPATIEAR